MLRWNIKTETIIGPWYLARASNLGFALSQLRSKNSSTIATLAVKFANIESIFLSYVGVLRGYEASLYECDFG